MREVCYNTSMHEQADKYCPNEKLQHKINNDNNEVHKVTHNIPSRVFNTLRTGDADLRF